MGKHTKTPNALPATIAIVAGVIALASGGAYAVGDMLEARAAGTGATAGATPTTAESPSTASSTSATVAGAPADDSGTGQDLLASCIAQVESAEALAAAAKDSAAHWLVHTAAYNQRQSGEITFAEAQKRYAASKASGLADEKAFAAATKARAATGSACMAAAEADTGSTAIQACTTRLGALDEVRTTGTQIQDEWSAHLRMMNDKAHTPKGAYHERWVDMVNAAQSTLKAYEASAAAVDKAPACG